MQTNPVVSEQNVEELRHATKDDTGRTSASKGDDESLEFCNSHGAFSPNENF
jgi:hypothetical protein